MNCTSYVNFSTPESLVIVLLITCVVIFSWRSVTADEYGRTKIGRIEFDPDQLLGKGCLGTKVYRGSFDGRDVAVKRLLVDSFALADREIGMLRQAEHPNLLRYYCSEKDPVFIYIALELCQCDLDAFILNRNDFDLTNKQIMEQCAKGIKVSYRSTTFFVFYHN